MNEFGSEYTPEQEIRNNEVLSFRRFLDLFDRRDRIIDYDRLPEVLDLDDELISRIRKVRELSVSTNQEHGFTVGFNGYSEIIKGDYTSTPMPSDYVKNKNYLGMFHSHGGERSCFSTGDYYLFLEHIFSTWRDKPKPNWAKLILQILYSSRQDPNQIFGIINPQDIILITKTDVSDIPKPNNHSEERKAMDRLDHVMKRAGKSQQYERIETQKLNTQFLAVAEIAREYKLGAYYQGHQQNINEMKRMA